MTLQAVVKSLDAVPEALHEEYSEGEDGRYYLDVHGVDEMPAVIGLKKNKNDLLAEKKELQEKLDAYDLSPDEIAELRERATKAGGEDVEAVREELEGKVKSVQQKADEEIEKAKAEAERAKKAAENYFLESVTTSALQEYKGEPALVGHVMRSRIKPEIVGEGDDLEFRAVVVGDDGQPRVKSSKGDPFSPVDLAAELREDPKYGRAFEGNGNSGSGANPNNKGGPGPGPRGTVQVKDGVVRADPKKVMSGEQVVQNE